MELYRGLHHFECGDLLILAIVLARSFCHMLVDRIVIKNLTKVYCISVSKNLSQYKVA